MEINNGLRRKLLGRFDPLKVEEIWALMSQQVANNYKAGKSTTLPGLGLFTFDHLEVNLNGTCNHMDRQVKQNVKVLIISNSFVEHFKSAIWRDSGLVDYCKRDCLPGIKVNFSQISLKSGLKLKEVKDILEHSLGIIKDEIQSVKP